MNGNIDQVVVALRLKISGIEKRVRQIGAQFEAGTKGAKVSKRWAEERVYLQRRADGLRFAITEIERITAEPPHEFTGTEIEDER